VLVAGCLSIGLAIELAYAWWAILVAAAVWLAAVWSLEAPRVLVGDQPSKARLVGLRLLGFGAIAAGTNLILSAVL